MPNWSPSANVNVNVNVGNQFIGGLLTVTVMLSGTGVANGDVLVNGVHAPGDSPAIGLAGLACGGYSIWRRRKQA